jgi:hypothetical protein
MEINDIAFVVFTNENNFPIFKLFYKFFKKNTSRLDVKLYVISNRHLTDFQPNDSNTILLSGETPYDSQGMHFYETVQKCIKEIKEKYIFLFCDDYLISQSFDVDTFSKLLKLIDLENIDMFSFGTHYSSAKNRPKFFIDYNKYGFNDLIFYELNHDNYLHAFSVQPCIWNKESFISLLNDNANISLHDLDCSKIKNKEKYTIIGTDFYMNDAAFEPKPFIFDYKEIIRFGVFLLTLNSLSSIKESHIEKFIIQLIKDEDILNKPEYDKYILFDKNLLN